MVDVQDKTTAQTVDATGTTDSPRQALATQDIRSLIPPLGLKEYWYPALEAKKIRRKPVGLKMLGVDLVFFRGEAGEVKTLWNVCAHRGGSLMHGDCHFPGTISCPYHGWTYDGDGNVLAVLPEGPESKIPGKVKQRAYPTRTMKGMVFVWMGDGEPVPIEEDVPPEFFDDHTMLIFAIQYWHCNWRIGLENGADSHVPYVHRDSIRSLMFTLPQTGPVVGRSKVFPGRALVAPERYRSDGQRRNLPELFRRPRLPIGQPMDCVQLDMRDAQNPGDVPGQRGLARAASANDNHSLQVRI